MMEIEIDEGYAEKIARSARIPLPKARARLAVIEADPELREAMWRVRARASDATVVTNVRRSGGEIEVAVAPDVGVGGADARARAAGVNLAQMRHDVATIEVAGARGHAPRTALPFIVSRLVQR